MDTKIERLRRLAQDALDEYHAGMKDGGEPIYPAWADDLLDVLGRNCRLGLAFYSLKIDGVVRDIDITDINGDCVAGLTVRALPLSSLTTQDTLTHIEQQRAAFEAAYIDHGGLRLEDYDLDYDAATNRYRDDCEQSAWWAWQTAVELNRQSRGAPATLPSDAEIIELWGDDYRPDDVVIFARALLARYGADQPSLAAAIHYPDCWDTAAYPTLADALAAVYEHFRCSECQPVAATEPSDDMPPLDERAAYSAEHVRQLIRRDRKLRAPVAAQEPICYLNPKIIDPRTGKVNPRPTGALTWSSKPVAGAWDMPVYACAPQPPTSAQPVASTEPYRCEDCPPIGYPTDATRCAPCDRWIQPAASAEPANSDILTLRIAGCICNHLDTVLDQSRIMAAAREIASFAAQQDADDWLSPTSLTGLSRDELIRQLQWALHYWMPAIAGDDTPDGQRCARDACLLYGMKTPVGLEDENTPTYWEKQQDAEKVDATFDLVAHLHRQRAWSENTFGLGPRAQGVVDHIRKELDEIEADPGDVKEWIDVAILALDGAWRSGSTPEQIVQSLTAKQTKNEGRTWPDWRTMDPTKAIEHDRSKDAMQQGGQS